MSSFMMHNVHPAPVNLDPKFPAPAQSGDDYVAHPGYLGTSTDYFRSAAAVAAAAAVGSSSGVGAGGVGVGGGTGGSLHGIGNNGATSTAPTFGQSFPTPPLAHHYTDQRRYAPGAHYISPLPGGYPSSTSLPQHLSHHHHHHHHNSLPSIPPVSSPPGSVTSLTAPSTQLNHYLEQYGTAGQHGLIQVPTTPTTGDDSTGEDDDDNNGVKPVIFPWMKKVHNGK